MKVSEKFATLVERLYRKTMDKTIEWELLNGDIACHLGQFSVFLTSTRGSDGEPFEYVELKDQDYRRIEFFSDNDLSAHSPSEDLSEPTFYYLMKSLREAAYRQAVGADDAIDSILNSLE